MKSNSNPNADTNTNPTLRYLTPRLEMPWFFSQLAKQCFRITIVEQVCARACFVGCVFIVCREVEGRARNGGQITLKAC